MEQKINQTSTTQGWGTGGTGDSQRGAPHAHKLKRRLWVHSHFFLSLLKLAPELFRELILAVLCAAEMLTISSLHSESEAEDSMILQERTKSAQQRALTTPLPLLSLRPEATLQLKQSLTPLHALLQGRYSPSPHGSSHQTLCATFFSLALKPPFHSARLISLSPAFSTHQAGTVRAVPLELSDPLHPNTHPPQQLQE